jgi:hypothetical protein
MSSGRRLDKIVFSLDFLLSYDAVASVSHLCDFSDSEYGSFCGYASTIMVLSTVVRQHRGKYVACSRSSTRRAVPGAYRIDVRGGRSCYVT